MNETMQTILQRCSVRKFSDRPIPEEVLDQILLAGTYAASGMNRQGGKIVVLRNPEEIAALERMNAAFFHRPGTHPFYGAGVVCVVLEEAGIPTAVEDGSLVIGNMMLAASSLGVGSCWIHRAREEFSAPEGKELLKAWGLEGNYIGVGHCILGYPEEPAVQSKPRKPDWIVKR